jgi:hypothetical protein
LVPIKNRSAWWLEQDGPFRYSTQAQGKGFVEMFDDPSENFPTAKLPEATKTATQYSFYNPWVKVSFKTSLMRRVNSAGCVATLTGRLAGLPPGGAAFSIATIRDVYQQIGYYYWGFEVGIQEGKNDNGETTYKLTTWTQIPRWRSTLSVRID